MSVYSLEYLERLVDSIKLQSPFDLHRPQDSGQLEESLYNSNSNSYQMTSQEKWALECIMGHRVLKEREVKRRNLDKFILGEIVAEDMKEAIADFYR